MADNIDRFLKIATPQLKRSSGAYSVPLTDEQAETMARALYIRLLGDDWTIAPPK